MRPLRQLLLVLPRRSRWRGGRCGVFRCRRPPRRGPRLIFGSFASLRRPKRSHRSKMRPSPSCHFQQQRMLTCGYCRCRRPFCCCLSSFCCCRCDVRRHCLSQTKTTKRNSANLKGYHHHRQRHRHHRRRASRDRPTDQDPLIFQRRPPLRHALRAPHHRAISSSNSHRPNHTARRAAAAAAFPLRTAAAPPGPRGRGGPRSSRGERAAHVPFRGGNRTKGRPRRAARRSQSRRRKAFGLGLGKRRRRGCAQEQCGQPLRATPRPRGGGPSFR